jgi:hypothetical protein
MQSRESILALLLTESESHAKPHVNDKAASTHLFELIKDVVIVTVLAPMSNL